MLKTTRSSVASAFRVDDDEVVGSGGGAGAESDGSSNKKLGVRILPEHTGINDHAIELVDDHPSHPQVLPSFLTGSRTDAFDCAPEVSIT